MPPEVRGPLRALALPPGDLAPNALARTALAAAALGASIALAMLAPIAPAHADETPSPVTLILGAVALPDYPGSDDRTVAPLVISRFSLGRTGVEIEGTEARLDLAPSAALRAGPVLGVVAPRDDGVSSAAVGALDGIDGGVELGGYVGFEREVGGLPEGTLSGHLAARQAVTGDDAGASATARLEYFFVAARALRFVLNLEATAIDGDRAARWFGVDADGANASGLAPFDADGGVRDVGAGVSAILSFSPSWGLYGRLALSRLVGDAADSPVTADEGDADQWLGGLGVLWSRR